MPLDRTCSCVALIHAYRSIGSMNKRSKQYAVCSKEFAWHTEHHLFLTAYAKNGDIALLQHSYSNAKSHEFGRTGPTDR